MGIAGGLMLIGSILLFAMKFSTPWLVAIYLLAVLASVAALIKYALWRIPRVKPGSSIYSNDAQDGFQASTYDANAIGKVGIVLSDLKPGGYIMIDAQQHQAISETGYIEQGEEVLVLRGEGESLIVRKK